MGHEVHGVNLTTPFTTGGSRSPGSSAGFLSFLGGLVTGHPFPGTRGDGFGGGGSVPLELILGNRVPLVGFRGMGRWGGFGWFGIHGYIIR